jgi:hypothetical protein
MEFKIDSRYIAVKSIKAVIAYLIGLALVLIFLGKENPGEFAGISLFAFIVLYFMYVYPRHIVVKDGNISFVKDNDLLRTSIRLADISKIDLSNNRYDTMTLITKSNRKYVLHPQESRKLEQLLKDSR